MRRKWPITARWSCATVPHTGRSPKDKFVVRDAARAGEIWWGANNQPLEPAQFASLVERVRSYAQRRDLFVQDCYAGADPRYRLPIRVISQYAWHGLFARSLFLTPAERDLPAHAPQFTVIDMAELQARPRPGRHQLRSRHRARFRPQARADTGHALRR